MFVCLIKELLQLFASIISNQVPLNAKTIKETLNGHFVAKTRMKKPIECRTRKDFRPMLFKVNKLPYAIL
jgi:hypothetical protein